MRPKNPSQRVFSWQNRLCSCECVTNTNKIFHTNTNIIFYKCQTLHFPPQPRFFRQTHLPCLKIAPIPLFTGVTLAIAIVITASRLSKLDKALCFACLLACRIREAPQKKNLCSFGHCPNSHWTPRPALKQALCGTYFRAKSCKCPFVHGHFS